MTILCKYGYDFILFVEKYVCSELVLFVHFRNSVKYPIMLKQLMLFGRIIAATFCQYIVLFLWVII